MRQPGTEPTIVRHPLPKVREYWFLASHRTIQSYHQRRYAGQNKAGCVSCEVGPGSVVHEAAVVLALSSGRLAGYAADVQEFEDRERHGRHLRIHPELWANPDEPLFTAPFGSAGECPMAALEAPQAMLSPL